jgi:hypothetical protein
MTGRGLTLHPEKTRVVDMSQPGGFDYLGYHFERDKKWPRIKSLAKLKDCQFAGPWGHPFAGSWGQGNG